MSLTNTIEGQLKMTEEVSLYTVKNPVEQPQAAVLIVHGLAEHLGRYEYVVEKLNSFGYSVYRFDHRGHGKSGGEKGYLDNFHDFLDDTDKAVAWAKIDQPDLPLFMLGHSMGGYIAAGYGVKYPGKLAGQIFSGPAVIVLPIFESLRTIDFDRLPRETMPNSLASLICRDQKVVQDYIDDPLVLKSTTYKLLGEVFIRGAEWLVERMETYTYPCLILHGGGDQIVTPEAARYLYKHISSEDKALKIYPDLYHEILNEFEKDAVLEDIQQWIEARI
ncbi:PldB protein [Candidatus Vecturithrix granuli]|uniref:PldB protein n=1 Tax=Vecturithrix granuli TaxID=1499967 RepID=A0A081C9B5_VECG1|nr:PldB protein [Candidatus Vecturithrix granuli]